MVDFKKYNNSVKNLERRLKNKKDSIYFRNIVNLLLRDLLPQFPDDVYYYFNCIAIDLTNGNGKYNYPEEMKEYFDIKNNGFKFINEDIERCISNEAKCFTKRNIQYSTLSVHDFEQLLKILNILRVFVK